MKGYERCWEKKPDEYGAYCRKKKGHTGKHKHWSSLSGYVVEWD